MKINCGMKTLPALALGVTFVCCVLSACQGKKNDDSRTESRDLYLKSALLTRRYTDSLLRAKDSAAVLRISEGFDEAMASLNNSYSPNADPGILEDENDTLTRLNIRLVEIRDSLLRRFGNPALSADSVNTDSLKKTPAKPVATSRKKQTHGSNP